jgi:DNA-nicking Smr family endonuclease
MIEFWSRPEFAAYSTMNIGPGTAHMLAHEYFNLGEVQLCHALIRCGAFLNQLNKGTVPMTALAKMSNEEFEKLPIYAYANKACLEGKEEGYLRKALPLKYMKALGFDTATSNVPSMKYCDLVANDWDGGSSSTKKQRSLSPADEDSSDIKVMLSNKEEGNDVEKTISTSATLKTLFNDYADECGVSLRSLRFSFNGSMLFLSTAGNKSAKDLGIADGGVIEVSNVNSSTSKENEAPVTETKGKKNKQKKRSSVMKVQTKKGRQTSVIFNPETDRQRHSKRLTKVLDEMEPQLKIIRVRINDTMLHCQKSKTRRPSSRKSLADTSSSPVFNPSMAGLGGKAGRSSFSVNIGKIDNLYKSSKKDKLNNATRASRVAKIDLHGCTQAEALERLNEWEGTTMDTAMKGEYPFVVPAVIVCGGGAQILSELVENWIREKKNVANAPKCSLLSQ